MPPSPLCSVYLLSPPYGCYTYVLPPEFPQEAWQVGGRVLVPVGRRLAVGVLGGLDADPPRAALRPLLLPLEREPFLDAAYLRMVEELAVRQLRLPGEVLARLVPSPLRHVPQVRLEGKAVSLRQLLDDPQRITSLALGWKEGKVEIQLSLRPPEPMLEVAVPPPWPLRPGAERQRAVLRHLDLHGPCSRQALRQALGAEAVAAVPALLRRGLVRLGVEPMQVSPLAIGSGQRQALNEDQTRAVAELLHLLDSPRPATALLFGVTGSGKTAVYLHLVEAVLHHGGCAMLLAPEIALALKLAAEVRGAFPQLPVLLYHGSLSAAQRAQIFLEARHRRSPLVVVGTRSALFVPVIPQLIVLDEEHDASFKQEEGLGYQAKEVAYARVQATNGLLVLGSATPDIKVYHAAQEGRIHLVHLPRRATPHPVPQVELVDLRPHGDCVIAPQARLAIETALGRDEQVIILHNRRGYAPILVCRGCQEPLRCPHCQISLTWHKGRSVALCHYCGFYRELPLLCPQCRAAEFDPLGEGTERLEEWLHQEFPDVGVARLDRDTARRPEAIQATLEAFARGQTQMLVGTQMLCKGHDFPGVTVVVVVDGDLGLNLPDYRAVERSFQMLVQVAGRAGRGEAPGRVLIQTRNPGHLCWDFVTRADFHGLYQAELALRQAMAYPPFSKLALVRLSIPKEGGDVAAVGRVGAALREAARSYAVTVLGPAPAPLATLRGRKRFHCLLKGQDWSRLRQVCQAGLEQARREHHIRMSVDFDPIDML